MEDYQKEALINCLINSYVAFEPLDVTNYLHESAMLDRDEVMKIRNEIVPWERVQLMLSFVICKEGNTYEELIKAMKLCEKYDELVKDLEASAGYCQKYNKKLEELLQSSSPEETYMFLNMLLSVAVSLDASDALKICKYLSFSDECIDTVKKSKNPGLVTMNFCRKTRIVKVSNIQALRELLKSASLVHQLSTVDSYIKALEHPELELEITKTEPDVLLDTVKTLLQDKTTWFKVGEKVGNMFHKAYDKTLLANIELDSCVLTLKVPTRIALNSLHRDICSKRLASRVLGLLLTFVQHQGLDCTADVRNAKITLELNEHMYRISKSRFGETLESQVQDHTPENCDYEATSRSNVPSLPGASGPEITVTITKSFPDTLLSLLRKTLNDKRNLYTRERALRTFFYQYFEDILCTRIRDGSNGVSFVLKVATVSALHRLYTAISKGELAEDILLTVQDIVGDHRVKSARICLELDTDDYRNAQKYFQTVKVSIGQREPSEENNSPRTTNQETVKVSIGQREPSEENNCPRTTNQETVKVSIRQREPSEENNSPRTTNQGSPSDPLFVDPESYEMIQRLHQERQDYENALLRSGTFGSK